MLRVWLEPGARASVSRDGAAYVLELGEATLIASETTLLSLLYQGIKDCERLSEHGVLPIRPRED